MKKIILYLFLLLIIKTFQQQIPEKRSFKVEIDTSYDSDMTEEKKEEKIQNLVNKYIQEQKWILEKEIDKEEFIKMFKDIIQRSALKQKDTGILKRFAEKAIEHFGEHIIVKNLRQYFEIAKLRKIILELYNTDL